MTTQMQNPGGGAVATEAIWLLPVLACPLVMSVMMFSMMRGMHRDHGRAERGEEDTK